MKIIWSLNEILERFSKIVCSSGCSQVGALPLDMLQYRKGCQAARGHGMNLWLSEILGDAVVISEVRAAF